MSAVIYIRRMRLSLVFRDVLFVVDEVIPFTNKQCKTLSRQIPQANITVRNFPLSVDELRKRTKIVDGGTIYLFATTLENGDKVLIKTHKI